MYSLDDAVKDYYDYVVNYLKEHNVFNEDVFQETVLKCFNVFQKREVHKENVVRYFLHSYRLNLHTKDLYKTHITSNEELGDSIEMCGEENECYESENHIDYMKLREFFYATYGVEKTVLLRRYNLGGYSIRELEEESSIKDLYYLFKKMTNDAKRHFA